VRPIVFSTCGLRATWPTSEHYEPSLVSRSRLLIGHIIGSTSHKLPFKAKLFPVLNEHSSLMAFRPKPGNSSNKRPRPSGAYPATLQHSPTFNTNKPARPSPLGFLPPPSPSHRLALHPDDDPTDLKSPALAPEGQAQIRDTLKTFPLFKDAPEDFLNSVAKKLRPQVHMPRDEIVLNFFPTFDLSSLDYRG
jgi:hypothetical protein